MAGKKAGMAADGAMIKEKRKHPVLRMMIFLLELLLLTAGVAGAVLYLKIQNDPKVTAQRYFDALLSGDYQTAYAYLQLDGDNIFLSEEAFAAVMENKSIAGSRIRNVSQEDDIYSLRYDRGTISVEVKEQEQKKFQIFKEYTVSQEDFMQEMTFIAPKDLTVSLNGIVLDDTNCEIDEESSVINSYETSYTVEMLAGEYIMEVSGENFKSYTEKIIVDPEEYHFRIYVESPYISDDLAELLSERAYSDLQEIYQDAMKQEASCDVLEEAKKCDITDEDSFDYYFAELKSGLQIEDGFFDYLELSEFTAQIYSYSYDYETGYLDVIVEINYKEEFGYQQLDWWTESYYEKYTDDSSGTADFHYAYIDGEWILINLYLNSCVDIW